MIRQVLFLSLFATVNSLHCLQGTVIIVDGFQYSNSIKSLDCGAITHCFKEKLSAVGDSGHKIQVIQYSCDSKKICDNVNLMPIAGKFDCQKPYDLRIGDFCCCSLDNCNMDNPIIIPPAQHTTEGFVKTHKPFPTFPTRLINPTTVTTTTTKSASGMFSILSLTSVIFIVR